MKLYFSLLQRQQFAVAQEMFKESPSLTREQKALILGFMAGSRGQLMKAKKLTKIKHVLHVAMC